MQTISNKISRLYSLPKIGVNVSFSFIALHVYYLVSTNTMHHINCFLLHSLFTFLLQSYLLYPSIFQLMVCLFVVCYSIEFVFLCIFVCAYIHVVQNILFQIVTFKDLYGHHFFSLKYIF
ncbi:unnamed protein product [Schistosoma mattheei]|uniref:Uncharacterized protein n=1 Tax=Schistosoma mattheei TaxID=31246 RepID=A0AA85BBS4_9TREM|nr:unnamed protein product [Schistosoma mattheei]